MATTDADSASSSLSGGVIDVKDLQASSDAAPSVEADIASDANIVAQQQVTVSATANEMVLPTTDFADGTFQLNQENLDNNTISSRRIMV